MSDNPMTFCIATHNNYNYLLWALRSLRENSFYKDAPVVIFAENCEDDGKDPKNILTYNEQLLPGSPISVTSECNGVGDRPPEKGIGGGMNECAKIAEQNYNTEYLMFLHADFVVSKNWDLEALKIFDKYPNIPLWVSSYRIQPNLFNEQDRPGTHVVDLNEFGYLHDHFKQVVGYCRGGIHTIEKIDGKIMTNYAYFLKFAEEFSKLNPNLEFEKGEGVSGLIRLSDWKFIGGNDPRYAPAYAEDLDLFLRMQLANYKFVLTSNSVVWHWGSRSGSSNFPTSDVNQRSNISRMYEQKSIQEFVKKWGFSPCHHNQDGFIDFPPNVDKNSLKHLIQIK